MMLEEEMRESDDDRVCVLSFCQQQRTCPFNTCLVWVLLKVLEISTINLAISCDNVASMNMIAYAVKLQLT